MPRDLEITLEMYNAIRRVFDMKIREMGCLHRIDKIYKATAESAAPCFFMTPHEAMSIVSHYDSGRARRRSRDLTLMRDNDFLDVYLRLKQDNPNKDKRDLVETALECPSKRFYINWRMVAFIISKRGRRK